MLMRRAPRGARGLKCERGALAAMVYSRAPRGARGLKFRLHVKHAVGVCVVPLAGHVD